MSESRANAFNKVLVAFIGVMMVLTVVSSAFFISAESHHDCIGEDCPICSLIEACETILHNTDNSAIILYAALLPVLFYALNVAFFNSNETATTLISQKVRMNN